MKKAFSTKYFVPIALLGLLITLSHAFQIQQIPRQRTAVSLLPDLTVSISRCPDKAFLGQRLNKLNVSITNHGRADALNFDVSLLFSKTNDSFKASNLTNLRRKMGRLPGVRTHINKLVKGASSIVSFPEPFKIPDNSVLGSYFLGAIVDPGHNVKESKEDNNSDSCQIKVWAELTSAIQQYEDSPPYLRLFIDGKGFENRSHKPTIKVHLGNYEVTQTGGNSSIIYGYPPQDIPAGESYWCYITDMQGTPVSNRVNAKWCFVMNAASPATGTWGVVVDIFGFNFGPSIGSRSIYFHTSTSPSTWDAQGLANVTLWTNNMIKVQVPEVSSGRYYIHIVENGNKVSCSRSVTFDVQ